MQPLPHVQNATGLVFMPIKTPATIHATQSKAPAFPNIFHSQPYQKLNNPLLRLPNGYTIMALKNKPTVIPIAT